MAAIQDAWQHIYIQFQDWPHFRGVWFSLQVSIFNRRSTATIFVVSGNGYHPRWPTTYIQVKNWGVFGFCCKSLMVEPWQTSFVFSDNGCHPRWLTPCSSCRLFFVESLRLFCVFCWWMIFKISDNLIVDTASYLPTWALLASVNWGNFNSTFVCAAIDLWT